MEIKKIKLLSILFFSIIFITMSFGSVYASLNGQASLITDSDNLDSTLFDDASVRVELSTGEIIEDFTNSNGEFSLDFDSVYCWEDCNIYPEIIIGSLQITKDDVTTIVKPNLKNKDELPFTFVRIFEEETEVENTNQNYKTINNNIDLIEGIKSNEGYLVEWNGTLLLPESGLYELMFDVQQGILIFNDIEYNISRDKNIQVNVSEQNEIYLNYIVEEDKSPNIYIVRDEDLDKISSEDLLFINGGSKRLESVSSFRVASSSLPQPDLTIHPSYQLWRYNNFNLDNEPVLLVHGLHGSDGYVFDDFSSFDYWYDNTADRLPKYLQSESHEPYMLVYVPANLSTRVYSVILKDSLQIVKSQHSVTKVDVVTHSMGGLLVRSYMNSLGVNPITGNPVSYGNEIDKVVFLATPNHGSYLANRVINDEAPFCAALTSMLPEDPDAEAYEELSVGSLFQWELNIIPIVNPSNYLVISGTEDIACLPDDITGNADINHAFDGFVSLPSASLLEQNVPLISMKLNHASIKGGEHTPWYWTDYTHDMSDDVGPIIVDFLEHTGTQTQLRNKITPDLEGGEYAIFPGISSNPYETGMVFVKSDANEVRLKNSAGTFYDLTEWEGNVWYWFGSDGLAIPTDIYSIYIDGVNTGETLEIFGAQTTLKEVSFSDSNTEKIDFFVDLSVDVGPTCQEYNYGIKLGQFPNLPTGLIFDINHPINTNHVRVYDLDNKPIDMITDDECVSCGVVPLCQTTARFSNILYNGQSINQGSCTTTSSQTQICWEDLDRVMLIRTLNTTPSCITPTNNMQINTNTKFCNGQYNLPNGIQIISGNIILDCNGAKLIGNTNGKSFVSNNYGLWIQQPNVTIQNCEISNYSHGIESNSNNLISSNILNSTFYWNFRGVSLLNKHNVQYNNFYNNIVGVDVSVSGTTIDITWNEIYNNSINLVNGLDGNINAVNNWWGTNNQIEISQSITDSEDIPDRGTVNFVPYIEKISLCVPLILNTSWSEWQNTSCLTNDMVGQTRFSVQYDSNNCGTFSNQTFSEYREVDSCDYCQPILVNTTFTEWQNQTNCMFGDYYIQNKSMVEFDSNYESCYAITNLPSDLWNNGQNKTHWEFRNQTCDFCTPNITNTTWSEWSNMGSCSINDLQNQTRFLVQYDSNICGEVQNQTYYESNLISCNYCSEDISNPIYTEWSACSEGIKTRTKYFIDNNYDSCCAITGLNSDCSINTPTYQNVTETSMDGCANNQTQMDMVLHSPLQSLSSDRRIQFNLTTNEIVDKITYIDNSDSRPREKSLCTRNCNGYGNDRAKLQSFSDGYHNLTFFAIKDGEIVDVENTDFLIDSIKPRISKIEPRRNSFINGSGFYIKYTEDNVQNIVLKFSPVCHGSGCGVRAPVNLSNCPSGRNVECSVDVNPLGFDGENLEYWFEITDIIGNKEISKPILVKVDTTSPVLNNPESFWEQGEGRYERYIYFTFNVTELNFDEINYIDLSESRPRETRICSRLRDGICEVKKSFRTGEHNLTINILDDAGNSIEESINFII